MMRKAGVFTGEGTAWDQDVRDALDAFFGAENLEERVDLDERTIDQPALIHLRDVFRCGYSVSVRASGCGPETPLWRAAS